MRRDERGASAVEYGLLIALCAAVFVAAVFAFQQVVQEILSDSACNESAGYDCTN